MQPNIQEIFNQAQKDYKQGFIEQAADGFCYTVYLTLSSPKPNTCLKEAMEMAVVCFRHKIPDEIFQNFKGASLPDRYFKLLRYYLDHRKETSRTFVRKEISKKIPFDTAGSRNSQQTPDIPSCDALYLNPYTITSCSSQGARQTQEDAHLIAQLENHDSAYLLALFDGHGGANCAMFCKSHIKQVLEENLNAIDDNNRINIYNALVKTCIDLDDWWKNLAMQQTYFLDPSGCTAVICLILNNREFWVANVGDSKCIIRNQKRIYQMTEPAKPTIEKYYNEIIYRGGHISSGRVDGSLDMTRSIGDINHPSVSARPVIRYKKFKKIDDLQLVLGCDGVFDVIDTKTAFRAIHNKDSNHAAKTLHDLAYIKGTLDNVSVIVASPFYTQDEL